MIEQFDLVARTEYQRCALVNISRFDIKDPLFAGACSAAGLLDQECDGVTLVGQAQTTASVSFPAVAGVKKDASREP